MVKMRILTNECGQIGFWPIKFWSKLWFIFMTKFFLVISLDGCTFYGQIPDLWPEIRSLSFWPTIGLIWPLLGSVHIVEQKEGILVYRPLPVSTGPGYFAAERRFDGSQMRFKGKYTLPPRPLFCPNWVLCIWSVFVSILSSLPFNALWWKIKLNKK